MSECVIRMEMPGCCWDCPCLDDYGDYPRCRISEEQRGYKFPIREKRMPNCPIICQLPEGHGRLIDASTIIGEVDAGYTDDYGNPIPANRPISVDEYLGLEVPTIVPAERSET